jgi:hypothetical protein
MIKKIEEDWSVFFVDKEGKVRGYWGNGVDKE